MFWKKNDKPGWFGSKLDDNEIALQSGDYSAIPRIFCVFAENHTPSKTRAASILCDVLDRLTFDEIVRIDVQMRQTTSMEWSINWRNYSIDDFFTSDMNVNERRAVVVFASLNPNGFVREHAVHMMKDYGGTLPFIVLRQNDWVSQVRAVALESADYRLSNLSDGELITALPFADKLSRSGRSQSNDSYTNRIYSVLTSSENERELIAGFKTTNIRTRRICTNTLFITENLRIDLLFDRLRCETDPFLRASIFRRLISAGQNMDDDADQFLHDKYPLNRILAFQYICDRDQNKALNTARNLFLDKNATVRENARYYMNGKCPDFDYRAFYKAHMADFTVSAIYGLGETGKAEDTAVIERYLCDAQISAVRAAMISIMRLHGTKYASVITGFLSDDRAGLVKAARNLIIKTDSPDYERVMEIFRVTPYENTKRKCFSILLTAGKWQRLIYILDILENGGEEISESAMTALRGWIVGYNRSYAAASEEQIKSIAESIERFNGKLSDTVRRQLRFLLR